MKTDANYILIDNELYIDRANNITIGMHSIIESGLREQLKLRGIEISSEKMQREVNKIITEQQNTQQMMEYYRNLSEDVSQQQEVYDSSYNTLQLLKHHLIHLEMQQKYNRKGIKHFHRYLKCLIDGFYLHPNELLDILMEQFPAQEKLLHNEIHFKENIHLLKQVKQKHKTSCGLACIASITNTPYNTVIADTKALFNLKKTTKYHTTGEQLIQLLSHYGIHNREHIIDCKWENCSAVAIVMINLDANLNKGHWVIYVNNNGKPYVIDPEHPEEKRIDFWNMHLDSYINI